MQVLRGIVDAILVEVPQSMPSRTGKWQRRTAAEDFKPTGSVETWSSYTHGYLHAAARIDRLDMLNLARSRRERAEDHPEALKCNIPYMRRQLQVLFGKPVWNSSSMSDQALFMCVQASIAVTDRILWRTLESETHHFCTIRSKFSHAIAQGRLYLTCTTKRWMPCNLF